MSSGPLFFMSKIVQLIQGPFNQTQGVLQIIWQFLFGIFIIFPFFANLAYHSILRKIILVITYTLFYIKLISSISLVIEAFKLERRTITQPTTLLRIFMDSKLRISNDWLAFCFISTACIMSAQISIAYSVMKYTSSPQQNFIYYMWLFSFSFLISCIILFKMYRMHKANIKIGSIFMLFIGCFDLLALFNTLMISKEFKYTLDPHQKEKEAIKFGTLPQIPNIIGSVLSRIQEESSEVIMPVRRDTLNRLNLIKTLLFDELTKIDDLRIQLSEYEIKREEIIKKYESELEDVIRKHFNLITVDINEAIPACMFYFFRNKFKNLPDTQQIDFNDDLNRLNELVPMFTTKFSEIKHEIVATKYLAFEKELKEIRDRLNKAEEKIKTIREINYMQIQEDKIKRMLSLNKVKVNVWKPDFFKLKTAESKEKISEASGNPLSAQKEPEKPEIKCTNPFYNDPNEPEIKSTNPFYNDPDEPEPEIKSTNPFDDPKEQEKEQKALKSQECRNIFVPISFFIDETFYNPLYGYYFDLTRSTFLNKNVYDFDKVSQELKEELDVKVNVSELPVSQQLLDEIYNYSKDEFSECVALKNRISDIANEYKNSTLTNFNKQMFKEINKQNNILLEASYIKVHNDQICQQMLKGTSKGLLTILSPEEIKKYLHAYTKIKLYHKKLISIANYLENDMPDDEFRVHKDNLNKIMTDLQNLHKIVKSKHLDLHAIVQLTCLYIEYFNKIYKNNNLKAYYTECTDIAKIFEAKMEIFDQEIKSFEKEMSLIPLWLHSRYKCKQKLMYLNLRVLIQKIQGSNLEIIKQFNAFQKALTRTIK